MTKKVRHHCFLLIVTFCLIAGLPAYGLAAISATSLTSGSATANATSFTTASITPGSNTLVLAFVFGFRTIGSDSTPTLSGNGLTWVNIDHRGLGCSNENMTLFRAMGAAPSAGAVTIDYGVATHDAAAWSIVEFSGVDTSGTDGSGAIVQIASGNAATCSDTSETATLAAFGSADNGTYFAVRWYDQTAPGELTTASPNAGFTELHDVLTRTDAAANNMLLQTAWRSDNSTTCTSTLDAGSAAGYIRGVEIKAAGAAGAATSPQRSLLGVGT